MGGDQMDHAIEIGFQALAYINRPGRAVSGDQDVQLGSRRRNVTEPNRSGHRLRPRRPQADLPAAHHQQPPTRSRLPRTGLTQSLRLPSRRPAEVTLRTARIEARNAAGEASAGLLSLKARIAVGGGRNRAPRWPLCEARFPRKPGEAGLTPGMLVAEPEQGSRDRSRACRRDPPRATGSRLLQQPGRAVVAGPRFRPKLQPESCCQRSLARRDRRSAAAVGACRACPCECIASDLSGSHRDRFLAGLLVLPSPTGLAGPTSRMGWLPDGEEGLGDFDDDRGRAG